MVLAVADCNAAVDIAVAHVVVADCIQNYNYLATLASIVVAVVAVVVVAVASFVTDNYSATLAVVAVISFVAMDNYLAMHFLLFYSASAAVHSLFYPLFLGKLLVFLFALGLALRAGYVPLKLGLYLI